MGPHGFAEVSVLPSSAAPEISPQAVARGPKSTLLPTIDRPASSAGRGDSGILPGDRPSWSTRPLTAYMGAFFVARSRQRDRCRAAIHPQSVATLICLQHRQSHAHFPHDGSSLDGLNEKLAPLIRIKSGIGSLWSVG